MGAYIRTNKLHNVLFIHGNSNNIAGQEKALLNTIKGLQRNGINCYVLLPSSGRFDRLLKDNGIGTYYIKLNRLRKKNPFPYLKTVYSIYKLIKKEKISLVHTSGAFPTQYCLPAARIAKIPCVSHIHSTVYSKAELRKSFVPYADCIIAVSEAVKKMLIKYGCSGSKTKTIYCGIIEGNKMNDVFDRKGEIYREYSIPEHYKIVGQVSQIIPRKGLEYFVQMAMRVKKLRPDVKFMIIGDIPYGYEDYGNKIKRMVKELGLEKEVIFTGFQRGVDKFISALDISILSSSIEGLPFIVVESLVFEKPVVATNIGGIPEVIINNQTGLLVPPKDADSLASAVMYLLNSPQRAKELGKNGRRLVLSKFTIAEHAKQLKNLYNFLLNKQNRKILFYETSSGFGGSTNALVNLINNLDKDKICSIVATTNLGEKIKEIKQHIIDVVRIKGYEQRGALSASKFLFHLMANIIAEAIKIYFVIKRIKVSIVHINTNIMLGIPAIIASKITKIPCVCHIRETRSLIKREKFFAKWVDKFILLNKDAFNLYKKDIPESKLQIVYDGINIDSYRVDEFEGLRVREEFNLDGQPLVGVVGRIVEGKGQKEFVLAAKVVVRVKPEVKFMIVGDAKGGKDGYYKEAEEIVKRENLERNIIFTGWRNDINNIVSSLDIFVFTSITFPEGLPNSILEAMALKRPVIATDIPGPRDIVIDGKTGFLVPPGDIKAMAEKIVYLLDNPEVAKRMGEAGRKRVEERFDIKKQVKKIEKIYEEVLSER